MLFAVTGAQGVGKSTFCQTLTNSVLATGGHATLLDGLGDRLNAKGVPLGRNSNSETIAAVFLAHLEREAGAQRTPAITILDRCLVDAMAYTRVLRLNTKVELGLYEAITARCCQELSGIIELMLAPPFEKGFASHETLDIRIGVANQIARILDELPVPKLRLNASQADAAVLGTRFILDLACAP